MRRLMLLIAAGTLWLFLAAIPALADGGPHVSSVNSGVSTLTADSCAGCHRAHTAPGELLINAATDQELCLTCHGAGSTGATTDVMTGVQYAIGTNGLRNAGATLGALRGGGFDQARIDAGSMSRLTFIRTGTAISQRPKVGVGGAESVTSAHIAIAGVNDLVLPGVAWGNGANGSGIGPVATVSCVSCHNPHGNGQFRILNVLRANATIPETWTVAIFNSTAASPFYINTVTSHGLQVGDRVTIAGHLDSAPDLNGTWFVQAVLGTGTTSGANNASNRFAISSTLGGPAIAITTAGTGGTVSRISGVPVTDATLPSAGDVRNYTVMQVKSPTGSGTVNGPETDYLLYASQVIAAATANTFNGIPGNYTATGGDYFARTVPWNPGINSACNPASDNGAQTGCATAPSAPNARPASFSGQITQWCASCHTRYFANNNPTTDPVTGGVNGATTGAAWQYPRPGDSLFNHQHRTVAGRDCLTCHVSHGSNAAMTGTFSSVFTYPDAAGGAPAIASASSRLLKVDNRGTCQACHDPTSTVAAGTLLPTAGASTTVP